jgi:hypothetical protein
MTAIRLPHDERGFFMDASIDYVKNNLPCKTCEHCGLCKPTLEIPADVVRPGSCAVGVENYILGKGCESYTTKIVEV